jgi:hypothetical protein
VHRGDWLHGDAVMRRLLTLLVVPSANARGTACGESVRTRVARAMDGCVAARNDAFKRGDGVAALAIPLPKAVDSLANATAYTFGLITYQETSDEAKTQAELTCALELGARFDSRETREWLDYYAKHPDAPVATVAARELKRLEQAGGGR